MISYVITLMKGADNERIKKRDSASESGSNNSGQHADCSTTLGDRSFQSIGESLRHLTGDFNFSLRKGDLQLLDNSWYVTHTGLLRLARRKRCRGIHVEAVDSLCDSAASRFVMKATVYPVQRVQRASSAMAMPTRQTCHFESAVPRCGWPRREPSIALCPAC